MKSKMEKPRQTIIGNIYETYNYEMFTFFEENRDLNPTNVERIIKSMKVKVNLCPIIVDPKLRVVDGQHRFEGFKELGLPVIYIVDENATIDDIQRLNSVSKTWSQKEYLIHYKKRGFKNYNLMHAFMIDYNLSIGEALLFLNGSRSGVDVKNFQYGKFKIKDMGYSKWFAEKSKQIKKINKNLGLRFYSVILTLCKNSDFDIDVLIQKMNIQPLKVVPCSTAKQTREMLEDIYNYRNRNKINLRIK